MPIFKPEMLCLVSNVHAAGKTKFICKQTFDAAIF